jgi:hypothetical protein
MLTTAAAPFRLFAWVDESVIVGPAGDPGTYTMAAVLADPAHCDELRSDLRGLMIRPGVRLHWVSESPKRRDLIAEAVGRLDIAAILMVGTPMERSRQERARRCCLERLLYELDQVGVSEVRLESRAAAQDRRDVRLIDSARRKRLISHDLQVTFARPSGEPMLWLPDAVAGAMSAAMLGEDRWLTAIAEVVTVHQVAIR